MATSNNTQVTNREFVSDATNFLRDLETKAENNQSAARQAEEAKYNRVIKLRDEVQMAQNHSKLWQGF
jgi:hypothetical protein